MISDSDFKAAQDHQNSERVSHLENVRADLLDSVNKVEAQIEALQTALPQAKQAIKARIAKPAAEKETCSLSSWKEFLWQGRTTTSSVAIHEAPASAGAFYSL